VRSATTSHWQTVIPAPIREPFAQSPAQRLEWIVEADGSIRVVPVDPLPVQAFPGMGRRGGSTEWLIAERQAGSRHHLSLQPPGLTPVVERDDTDAQLL
jgi:bifunctional DNA-binding transcriptional regulator/antitoxin component of YhaV-PrlF toxin-antitoxin module